MVEFNYTIVAAGHCRCPQRASKCALTDDVPILVPLADPLPLTALDLLLIGERILLGALQLLMKRIARCLMGGDQDADALLKGTALHVEGESCH